MASEMLYPIMPIYLQTIGFSVVFIGILEGLAEATAGFSKGYFGKLSDSNGKRVPFVQIGYALSALSKPMMALIVTPIWVFAARTLDRIGKGIRTGARDAMLSDQSTPATKARVFGFHRSMDTLGAVLGPSLALIYLYFNPEDYKTLFLLAFFPGILAVLATLFLREKQHTSTAKSTKTSLFSFLKYWNQGTTEYRSLVTGLLAFTLFNSSDVFLLLKAKQAGLADNQVIGIYIFYNLVYSIFAYPVGIIADKIGLKNTYIIGIIMFSFVYIGMAFCTTTVGFILLFFMYGVYAAATEGISKAWISKIASSKDTATAIGTYASFQSLCAMLASSIAGLLWFQFGSIAVFLTTGIATIGISVYFLIKVRNPNAPVPS